MEPSNESPAIKDPEKESESPKAASFSFTVDFGDGKSVDMQRHKVLVEKFQKKHRRGQSLSKLETESTSATKCKQPLTGNLPRKSSFQSSEGYFSSDERPSPQLNRSELTLPLKNLTTDRLKSPKTLVVSPKLPSISSPEIEPRILRQLSNPETVTTPNLDDIEFIESGIDLEKIDNVSDTGTYTLDGDNYSEEQKARMSIDTHFKIEQISVEQKTEDYLNSLYEFKSTEVKKEKIRSVTHKMSKLLSPILSPTQNLSITENGGESADKDCVKILFPSAKSKIGLDSYEDQGSVISVTSSGAFRSKNEKEMQNLRRLSLTKSDIQVEAYVGDQLYKEIRPKQLTARVVNVQSIPAKLTNLPPISPTRIPSPIHTLSRPRSRTSLSSLNVDLSDSSLETESYLKPTQNYIDSLQKKLGNDCELLNNSSRNNLLSHTRHNSLDDSPVKISNKLEHFQTKNLQAIDQTYANLLGHKVQNSPVSSPIRRSSSFSTKHHNNNNNQGHNNSGKNVNLSRESNSVQRSASSATIKPNGVQRRPMVNSRKIDREQFGETESSSEEDFEKRLSRKKDLSNLTTTRYNRAFSLRRARLDDPSPTAVTNSSSSTSSGAPPRCPNTPEMRRKFPNTICTSASSAARAHERAMSMDRKTPLRTDVQSRYLQNVGGAQSTRRPTSAAPIGGGGGVGGVRAQQRSTPSARHSTGGVAVAAATLGGGRSGAASAGMARSGGGGAQSLARTDSGRYSMRGGPANLGGGGGGGPKRTGKKDDKGKSSGRSNSSLSCREKEFQNWKRRKSYDPMKAAAEGKRKELMAKKQSVVDTMMTQSYNENVDQNQDCDSSPSRSSSVHRSQSFHGTAALNQLLSSDDDDELTLSADEGFSPPTPSPSHSTVTTMPNLWREHVLP